MNAEEYTNNYWAKITRFEPRDRGTLIGVPNPYIVPGGRFREMFYWDSYFIMLGLTETEKQKEAKYLVDNCLHLIRRFGFVPNATRTFYLTRSQPPFLTSMIAEIFALTQDKKWLKSAFELAKKEYAFWHTKKRVVLGLNRWHDKNGRHEDVENESGWDLTPRFFLKGNNFLPIDLNCLLYKYEIDFAKFSKIMGMENTKWLRKAEERKKLVNMYMWKNKFFYDYDFVNRRHSVVKSLAAYYTLWCDLANKEQAKILRNSLRIFEYKYGLATCDKDYGYKDRQWNYPNGWAPLHWITAAGLKKYGYKKDAERVARKWILVCEAVYQETGKMWEKYNVVRGTAGTDDKRYKNQEGFGWTNAIYLAFKKGRLK